jgi:hypothetical protein
MCIEVHDRAALGIADVTQFVTHGDTASEIVLL